jgi:hypothetical protein
MALDFFGFLALWFTMPFNCDFRVQYYHDSIAGATHCSQCSTDPSPGRFVVGFSVFMNSTIFTTSIAYRIYETVHDDVL